MLFDIFEVIVILFQLFMFFRRLQHPNLVKLYGICTSCSPIRIVTEFMKNGNYLLLLSDPNYLIVVTVKVIIWISLITSAEEGGYVFGSDCLSVCLFVCLSVGLLANL